MSMGGGKGGGGDMGGGFGPMDGMSDMGAGMPDIQAGGDMADLSSLGGDMGDLGDMGTPNFGAFGEMGGTGMMGMFNPYSPFGDAGSIMPSAPSDVGTPGLMGVAGPTGLGDINRGVLMGSEGPTGLPEQAFAQVSPETKFAGDAPPEVLSAAKPVALESGSPGVSNFMTQTGFPKTDAWSNDFTKTVQSDWMQKQLAPQADNSDFLQRHPWYAPQREPSSMGSATGRLELPLTPADQEPLGSRPSPEAVRDPWADRPYQEITPYREQSFRRQFRESEGVRQNRILNDMYKWGIPEGETRFDEWPSQGAARRDIEALPDAPDNFGIGSDEMGRLRGLVEPQRASFGGPLDQLNSQFGGLRNEAPADTAIPGETPPAQTTKGYLSDQYAPEPAPAQSPAGVREPPAAIKEQIDARVPEADRGYYYRLAEKESNFNPNLRSKTGATGLYQWTKGTARQYGLMGAQGDFRKDVGRNIDATVRFTEDNRAILTKGLGREPSYGEMALAHQQGPNTAVKMLNGTGNAPARNLRVNNAGGLGPQAAANKIMGYYNMPAGPGAPAAVAAAPAASGGGIGGDYRLSPTPVAAAEAFTGRGIGSDYAISLGGGPGVPPTAGPEWPLTAPTLTAEMFSPQLTPGGEQQLMSPAARVAQGFDALPQPELSPAARIDQAFDAAAGGLTPTARINQTFDALPAETTAVAGKGIGSDYPMPLTTGRDRILDARNLPAGADDYVFDTAASDRAIRENRAKPVGGGGLDRARIAGGPQIDLSVTGRPVPRSPTMDNYPPTDQVNPAAAAPAGMPGAQPTAMGGGMPAPFALLQQLFGGGGGGGQQAQPQQGGGGGGLFGGQGGLGGFLTPSRIAALSLILNKGNPVPGMPTMADAWRMEQAQREVEQDRQATEALLIQLGVPPEQARLASRSRSSSQLALKLKEMQDERAQEEKYKASDQRLNEMLGGGAPDPRRPAPINPVTPADYATGVWPADPDITPVQDRPSIQSITTESIERELRKPNIRLEMRDSLLRELRRRETEARTAGRGTGRRAQTEEEKRQDRAKYVETYHPDWPKDRKDAFILSGKDKEEKLTSKEEELVTKAELGLPNWRSMLLNFERAREINFDTFEDYTAMLRAKMIAKTPAKEYVDPKMAKTAKNTLEWDNIMGLEAINKMSQVMKGATTEKEMAEHLKRIADASLPIELRQRSLDRLIFLVEDEIRIRENQARGIRDKSYFRPGGGESGRGREGYKIEELKN